jgi:hypothetical protein
MRKFRERIEKELAARRLQCSTQALNALYYATVNSAPEIVGCSDSLLLGLLQSGSYTIDALIDSGVDTAYLRDISTSSVTDWKDSDCDPVKMLFAAKGVFGSYLRKPSNKSGFLETANLLEIAISPESLDGSSAGWFPRELSDSAKPSTKLLQEIENQVCYVIAACLDVISKKAEYSLRRRQKPLTKIEKEKINIELSDYIEFSEAEWAISLTNEWLTKRKLCLHNPEISLGIIDRLYGGLRFGSSLFMESGGNFNTLSTSLQVAKRYAPERDQPFLSLLERDGRIYIKNYSYKNSTLLHEDNLGNVLSIGSEIPLPLTTLHLISEFEEIINHPNVREEKIQKFLEFHPEIIESLGYASCKPHVILKQPGMNDLIPDFILQRPGNNGFDILDLKLPTARIAVSSPFLRVSHEISKALGQLRAYRNYFNSQLNISKFHQSYGLQPLTPELIVVIGRCSEILSFQDRVEINNQSQGLRIITYDELIDYGRSRAINFKNTNGFIAK